MLRLGLMIQQTAKIPPARLAFGLQTQEWLAEYSTPEQCTD